MKKIRVYISTNSCNNSYTTRWHFAYIDPSNGSLTDQNLPYDNVEESENWKTSHETYEMEVEPDWSEYKILRKIKECEMEKMGYDKKAQAKMKERL